MVSLHFRSLLSSRLRGAKAGSGDTAQGPTAIGQMSGDRGLGKRVAMEMGRKRI